MIIWILFAVLVTLAALDSWLTRKALKCGCLTEANWIMRKLPEPWKYVFKGLVILALGALSIFCGQWVAILALDGWLAYVCFKNWRLIRKYD